MKSIIIIGMAGVGKTTVGKLLAEKLGMEFIDLDKNIELRCGVDISRIFEIEGEDGFREREAAELRRVLNNRDAVPCILSIGGGCIADEVNREIIRQGSELIIQLYANVDDIVERIAKSPLKRPLFNTYQKSPLNIANMVSELYQERKNSYDSISDIKLDTSLLRPNQAVDKVLELIDLRACL